ncbi:MAG TPA: PEP-CTERM sorting domain-containing protein [Burkholderiaceae bacterium]
MKQQVSLGKRAMQLALCATVAGAALTAQTAYADVISVNFTSNPLSVVPFNIDGLYLNVVTGATGTASFAGYDLNPYFSGTATPASTLFRILTPSTGGMVAAGGIATSLAAGTSIGAASVFASGVVNANAATSGINYFGFKFINEGTGITNYGYLVVQQTANPPIAGSVTILGYAYENAGASITVSAVPEPATAMMLLGGMLAIGAWRGRKTGSKQA